MNYRIEVTYAAGNTNRHGGLDSHAADVGAGAFLRDLFGNEGEGVAAVRVAVELPPCSAVLYHGPGHQSKTRCRLEGPHEVHEAVYGGAAVAHWRGDEASTGFFDEPPDVVE